jgi:hypothetical protein
MYARESRSPRTHNLSPKLLSAIVGVDADGLPPVRIDLAAEHLIEHDVDIYLDVPGTGIGVRPAPSATNPCKTLIAW